jgi:hypothetical protein
MATKGHYGWIVTQESISHPDAWKRNGSIYLDPRDIRVGTQMNKGDAVVFYLYVDEHGLGAEDCRAAAMPVALQDFQQAVLTEAPLWLLDDSDDDDDGYDQNADSKPVAQAASGADETASTACGSAQSSPGLPEVIPSDDEWEEDLSSNLHAELRKARAQAERLTADLRQPPENHLQAELRQAKAHAGRLAAEMRRVVHSTASKEEEQALASQLCQTTTEGLPSKGSVLHASGECRRCNFFAKGCCTKGNDCCFCHFPHAKQDGTRKSGRGNKGKSKKAQLQKSMGIVQPESADAPSDMGDLLLMAQILGPPPGL